jgi:hypothetical protein
MISPNTGLRYRVMGHTSCGHITFTTCFNGQFSIVITVNSLYYIYRDLIIKYIGSRHYLKKVSNLFCRIPRFRRLDSRVSDYVRDENPTLLGSRKCTTGSIRATGLSSNAQPQRPATPNAERQIGSLTIMQHQSRSRVALNPTTLLSQSNIVHVLPHQTNPTIFPST